MKFESDDEYIIDFVKYRTEENRNKNSYITDNFDNNLPCDDNSYDIFSHYCNVPNINKAFMYNYFFNRLEILDGDGRVDLIELDLKNKSVLDLGCFEGGHTYQFEKRGAIVTGIEADKFSFLKCLINKNTLNMKSKFLLGCANKYMEKCMLDNTQFDLIFCCGILYHMIEPVKMLNLMSKISNNFYIWTLIVSEEESKIWDKKI